MEEAIRQFVPDVVIIDREDFAAHAEVTLSELLCQASGMKVIDVSTNSNMVRLFEGRQIGIAQFEDLMAAIGSSE